MTQPDPQDGAGAAPPRNPRSGSLALVARVPFYRGATLALFLSGVGFSAAAPQIATFLVRELDASLTTAGLYYLTNLTAPIAGYLIGARSDRTGRRLGLFRVCALVGALGWAGIALSTQLWMSFVLSALALAVIAGRRWGMLRLMVLGAGFGVGANLLFALPGSAAGLFAGQVPMGGVWGIFAVLGIIVAQRLLPGALGGIGTGVLGLPLVFLVPGALGVVAMIGLLMLDRRMGDRLGEAARTA